jgi:hypothetical protein
MTKIDKTYRKQIIENVDVDLPYIDLSFVNNLPFIKTCLFIFVVSALFLPLLPPLHNTSQVKWPLPASLADYFGQVKDTSYILVLLFILIILANVLSNLRTFIDRRLGYQKVGFFKVRAVLNLWTRKLVFLNNAHFLMLHRNDVGFTDLAAGQVAEIERTATHQLIYCRFS